MEAVAEENLTALQRKWQEKHHGSLADPNGLADCPFALSRS